MLHKIQNILVRNIRFRPSGGSRGLIMHRLHASLREFFLRGFKCMQNKMDNRVVTLLHFFFFKLAKLQH